MKVVWGQDMDFITHGGGAQLSDRAHFLKGVKRGHDLSILTPNSDITMEDLMRCEVLIASNPLFMNITSFKEIMGHNIPYIWFFHDYAPLCKYRLFYPMRDTCKLCYLKERWLPVFLKSRLIIWLSPLHRESWLYICPELEDIRYHLAPSPVNVELFSDLGLERKGAISVESLHPFKGREHVIKWANDHQEVDITFVSGNPLPEEPLPLNCKVMGAVPYRAMNELYNKHEMFLHLPQSPSPFDRCVVEAYLAGCKVIGNELIGALSYSWFKSRRDVSIECSSSSTFFWEAVEDAMGIKS